MSGVHSLEWVVLHIIRFTFKKPLEMLFRDSGGPMLAFQCKNESNAFPWESGTSTLPWECKLDSYKKLYLLYFWPHSVGTILCSAALLCYTATKGRCSLEGS